MFTPPSGRQYEIAFGQQRATVVEVGGGIRSYCVGDRDVLHPYAVDALYDGAHGAPLIPWPKRLADGRYRFDVEGTPYDFSVGLPLKESPPNGPWRRTHDLSSQCVQQR